MTRKPCLVVFMLHVYCCAVLIVTQSPTSLELLEGQSAVITCTWDPDDRTSQIRLNWKKSNISSPEEENKTVLAFVLWTESNNSDVTKRNWDRTVFNLSKNKAEIQIDSVTTRDSGIYFCDVHMEIPTLQNGRGNGTKLDVQSLVTTDKKGKGGEDKSNKYHLAIIAIVPLMMLIGYFLYKRKKKIRNHVSEDRKQESIELNQLNSDVNDADRHSSSSSNSVKWAVSTLYESCDYFAMKHPENKTGANVE